MLPVEYGWTLAPGILVFHELADIAVGGVIIFVCLITGCRFIRFGRLAGGTIASGVYFKPGINILN